MIYFLFAEKSDLKIKLKNYDKTGNDSFP